MTDLVTLLDGIERIGGWFVVALVVLILLKILRELVLRRNGRNGNGKS